jgi:outer membrane lipoprotein-sorting protein
VVQKSDPALKEIGPGFEKGYRFKKSDISLKEPGKARVEGKYGILSVLYITNGDRKLQSVPSLRIRKVKNIAAKPGEKQTPLDIGIVTPALANQFTTQFLRHETRGAKKLAVFEVAYKAETGGRKHHVWIDPNTRTVVEHQVFHRRGGVKMRYLFHEPVKYASNVWLPSRMELFNGSGKLAAVTRYENIRVNSGLAESLFQF